MRSVSKLGENVSQKGPLFPVRWFAKGFWAISDQGLFAVSNFALNILLARWLSIREYGAFSVAFTVLLLCLSVFNALLIEPMMVFGASRYRQVFPEYLRRLIGSSLILSLAVGVVVAGASCVLYLLGSKEFAVALGVLIVAAPALASIWLMRRACYVRSLPHKAAFGSAIYALLLLTGAFALYEAGLLSGISALLLMSVCNLLAAAWISKGLGALLPRLKFDALSRDVSSRHWGFGRWGILTNSFSWVPRSSYFTLLPLLGAGLDDSAALRALMNLLMPALQGTSALSMLLLPVLVRVRGDVAAFRRYVRGATSLFVCGMLGYWTIIGWFHEDIVRWIYNEKYIKYSDLLWLLGLSVVAQGGLVVAKVVLRSLEYPKFDTLGSLVAAGIAFILGIFLISAKGVVGASAAFAITYWAWFVMTIALTRKIRQISHQHGQTFE